jgi:hypothetical protein
MTFDRVAVSDNQIVVLAALDPNLALTLHDVTEKPLPISEITDPPEEVEVLVECFGAARSISISAGEPSTIGAWAMKCDT